VAVDTSLAVDLARIQFAFTVSLHIIFPAFSIGLASYLAVLEGLWLWTGRQVYLDTFKYWLKIFAVAFAMGVVSGIVMSYQFGTNWSVFADKTGPVLGPLMGYEVLSAFFLEAGFLGVMLFGLDRVGKTLHFIATLIVAGGTLLSAFWILSVNSWMQTPAGYAVNAAGQFVPTDWWAVVFNASFPYRLVHMVLAAYLTTAFVVGAVGAWHLLRDARNESARVMFSMAMWMAVVVAPIQIVAGDMHGLNTLAHQPAKVAAMEGHFETRRGAPLILFGVPDDAAETTRYAVEIPNLGSLILTHDWDGEVKGLKAWPKNARPPAAIVFWSFRIMVGLGVLMVLIGVWSLVQRLRGRLYQSSLLQWAAIPMGPSGFVAVLAGWITTEVGRQPYTVYGLLRTDQSIAPIDAPAVASSLAVFAVVYFIVFGAGVFYLLRLMSHAPEPGAPGLDAGMPIRSAGIAPALGLAPGAGDGSGTQGRQR
jgi:cytochrome bd ubiquinol oxidase subunit I